MVYYSDEVAELGLPSPSPSELCPFVAGLVANESFLGCPGVPLSMLCSHPLQTAFTVTMHPPPVSHCSAINSHTASSYYTRPFSMDLNSHPCMKLLSGFLWLELHSFNS